MDGLLFDTIEYIDTDIAADVLKDLTCRQCDNQFDYGRGHFYCKARKSGRTNNGYLRCKSNQPACILFTPKDNAK